MTFTRIVNAVLVFPAVLWSAIGIGDVLLNGFYSNTSVFPLPFKIHTLSLLNMTTFFVVTFLTLTPRKPLRNLTVVVTLVFLFNAVYEFVYAIFYDLRGLVVALPLSIGAISLLFLLNSRFHFLTRDKRKISLAVLGFSCFIVTMIALNQTGFFEQVRLYLSGQSVENPHSPLWFLSKVLCLWMLFPLLKR